MGNDEEQMVLLLLINTTNPEVIPRDLLFVYKAFYIERLLSYS